MDFINGSTPATSSTRTTLTLHSDSSRSSSEDGEEMSIDNESVEEVVPKVIGLPEKSQEQGKPPPTTALPFAMYPPMLKPKESSPSQVAARTLAELRLERKMKNGGTKKSLMNNKEDLPSLPSPAMMCYGGMYRSESEVENFLRSNEELFEREEKNGLELEMKSYEEYNEDAFFDRSFGFDDRRDALADKRFEKEFARNCPKSSHLIKHGPQVNVPPKMRAKMKSSLKGSKLISPGKRQKVSHYRKSLSPRNISHDSDDIKSPL